MGTLRNGMKAPAFTLPASDGTTVSLGDFAGRRIVLYFYPKDDTPGCTVEACGFRDRQEALTGQAAVVLGISPDSVASHQRFSAKFTLPFLLLSDEERTVCKAYGVWVKKSMYGRTYLGVARTTFVIGPDGRIEEIYAHVKPQGHAEAVLAFLRSGQRKPQAAARRARR